MKDRLKYFKEHDMEVSITVNTHQHGPGLINITVLKDDTKIARCSFWRCNDCTLGGFIDGFVGIDREDPLSKYFEYDYSINQPIEYMVNDMLDMIKDKLSIA